MITTVLWVCGVLMVMVHCSGSSAIATLLLLAHVSCIVVLAAQSCPALFDSVDVARQAPLSRNSPGKYTGVGRHSLLQGIFPTQGSNLGHLHWQVDSLLFEPPGKPLFLHRKAIYSAFSWNASSELMLGYWHTQVEYFFAYPRIHNLCCQPVYLTHRLAF